MTRREQSPKRAAWDRRELRRALPRRGKAFLAGVVDHIDHFSSIIGPGDIALGSDFDGLLEQLPDELKDVSQLPKVAEELAARGYSESAIQGIMGENLLRAVASVIG